LESMRLAINGWFWDQPATGSGQTVRYLSQALLEVAPNLKITLILPLQPGRPPAVDVPAGIDSLTLPVKPGHLGKVWFEQQTFPQAARRCDANLAHVPYFAPPLSSPVPLVATIHDLITIVLPSYRGGLAGRLYNALVSTGAAHARLIFADSEASRNDVIRRLRLPPEKVKVVYLAQAPHFSPIRDSLTLKGIREKYHLPAEFILYMGGFDVRKNITGLLHAYTFVYKALGGGMPLVLGGALPLKDTALFPHPLRLAKELKIEEAVICPGWIDEEDKPALYSAAKAFVYPSTYEGFGLPILEAMACGTPVVTSNTSSIPELAGPDAFQIDPRQTREMAAAIISLCLQEELHREMSERGLARAAQFSWRRTATQTIESYQYILERVS
jgi:glycosyltransferase involved in cell wall biosynthesis